MQRVRIIYETDVENTLIRTYIIYDDIKSKYVFDICAMVPTSYQIVMIDGGEAI